MYQNEFDTSLLRHFLGFIKERYAIKKLNYYQIYNHLITVWDIITLHSVFVQTIKVRYSSSLYIILYSVKRWQGKTLAKLSFLSFGEENFGEFTLATSRSQTFFLTRADPPVSHIKEKGLAIRKATLTVEIKIIFWSFFVTDQIG